MKPEDWTEQDVLKLEKEMRSFLGGAPVPSPPSMPTDLGCRTMLAKKGVTLVGCPYCRSPMERISSSRSKCVGCRRVYEVVEVKEE